MVIEPDYSHQIHWKAESSSHSPTQQQPVFLDNSQSDTYQEVTADSDSHLQSSNASIQQYSPLHIPQLPSTLGVSYTPLTLASQTTTQASSVPLGHSQVSGLGSSKIRGASDCPGMCPLCGSTLRQARNLRRHLLSSCKYRFSIGNQTGANRAGSSDPLMIEIKREVDEPTTYMSQTINCGPSSGGSSCEQIVCKPSPLPSPTLNSSNISTSTVARWKRHKRKSLLSDVNINF